MGQGHSHHRVASKLAPVFAAGPPWLLAGDARSLPQGPLHRLCEHPHNMVTVFPKSYEREEGEGEREERECVSQHSGWKLQSSVTSSIFCWSHRPALMERGRGLRTA